MVVLCTAARAQPILLLRGTVTDRSTGAPLVAANVRLIGTARGTITNGQGNYSLALEPGPHLVAVTYLGYQPETLRTPLASPRGDVALTPSVIEFPAVVVVAEDPAVEIIRKAIAHKREWMRKIRSYQFEAFTRQVLRRDTSIASITEAYTTGFWRSGDTLREIVRQKRQTENIPSEQNFAAVRRIVNFNDDEITLFTIRTGGESSGYIFTGPTAPDALEEYDYRLLSTAVVAGVEMYRVQMTPKTRTRPLFDGVITIADGTFAVVGVDVTTNEAFTMPFLREIRLRYRQQFALYESEFWMPADIRIEGGFTVSFVGLSLPRIGIEAVSAIYDYAINPSIPDTVFRKPLVSADTVQYDTTYWRSHEILPLTGEEQTAYRILDSTQTLAKQFEPQGPLASLGGSEGTGSVLSHVDFRFNRVEGFFFGGKTRLDSLPLRVDAEAGYAFDAQRWNYTLRGTLPLPLRGLRAGAEWYARLGVFPDRGYYGPVVNSFMALIDKNDYNDYFQAQGYALFLIARPTRRVSAELRFLAEREYALDIQTSYSLFSREMVYRPNPPAQEGLLRGFRFTLRMGDEPVPLDLVSRNALELSVEHSSPSIVRSEFDFTRYEGVLSWHFRTFGRGLLFPPQFRLNLSAGTSARALPAQRAFTLDARSSGYAPFGVLKGSGVREFSGDRYVMIVVEENFRSVPFLALDLPFLYRNGIEILTHAAFAQTWRGATSTSDGWYVEAGIGVSRILDLLRVDLTYRWKEPSRFFITVGVANLL
jgi:hypothetical protein